MYISRELLDILATIVQCDADDRIAQRLQFQMGLTTADGDYLSFKAEDGHLSYRPANRINPVTRSNWNAQGRMSGRPARVIRRFLVVNDEYPALPDTAFERFTNNLTAYKDYVGDFELVSGELIRYWYDSRHYAAFQGDLSNSCMRYRQCQSYFDIYVKNPDVCQLLILTRPTGPQGSKQLCARALVWTLADGTKQMDRVYGLESIQRAVENWARQNDIRLRYDASITDARVQLKAWRFPKYPYLDSYTVLDRKTGELVRYRGDRRHVNVLLGTAGTDWSGPRDLFLVPIIRRIAEGEVRIGYLTVESISERGAERAATFELKRNHWNMMTRNVESRAYVKGMADFDGIAWRKMNKLERRYFGMDTHSELEDS